MFSLKRKKMHVPRRLTVKNKIQFNDQLHLLYQEVSSKTEHINIKNSDFHIQFEKKKPTKNPITLMQRCWLLFKKIRIKIQCFVYARIYVCGYIICN